MVFWTRMDAQHLQLAQPDCNEALQQAYVSIQSPPKVGTQHPKCGKGNPDWAQKWFFSIKTQVLRVGHRLQNVRTSCRMGSREMAPSSLLLPELEVRHTRRPSCQTDTGPCRHAQMYRPLPVPCSMAHYLTGMTIWSIRRLA